MSEFKIVWLLAFVNSISLQYNKEYSCCLHSEILASLESCDGRNNHNVHTTQCPNHIHTQHFQTWSNFIIKNKVKIMDKDQNNYYNTQLSDIHLAPSLCWVKRHNIYRVSQEECARLREDVPYAKVYRYNPKHLCPKLNGYGDNGQWSLELWQLLHTYWLPNTY